MGSLCGASKSTTTQNSSQQYTPRGLDALNDIWSRVQEATSSPYTPYGGQMVAGLTPLQQTGITNIANAYGSAQPYFTEAADYARTGAAPINPNDITRYVSPYTSQVIDATRANFAETNAQQQSQVLGNAAKVNALGGDRVSVAQAELARQQKLAQDPVIAGMYDNAYTRALGAVQADRSAAAQGAYTFGALAPSIQNAQIQGAQAQVGAGTIEQQNQQQQLNANYQEYLRALAFPYQQASFLSSSGLPAITAMGGSGTGTTQTTTPGPSPFSQIAGLGLAAAGMMTGNPMAAMGAAGGLGGLFGGGSSQGLGGNPNQSLAGYDQSGNFYNYAGGGSGFGFSARGGRINRSRGGRLSGEFADTVQTIRQALRGGGAVLDTERNAEGIYVPTAWIDEGNLSPFEAAAMRTRRTVMRPQMMRRDMIDVPEDIFARAAEGALGGGMGGVGSAASRLLLRAPYQLRSLGYAEGGEVPFADRFTAVLDPTDGDVQPDAGGVILPTADVPLPRPRPSIAPTGPYGAPSQPMPIGATGATLPATATPTIGPHPYAAPAAPASPYPLPAPMTVTMGGDTPSGPFGLSEDARLGMIAAGLGMAASKSPFALSAIGEGGLTGLSTYIGRRDQRSRIDQEARRLAQQAGQFAQTHSLGQERHKETVRYHDILDRQRQDAEVGRNRRAELSAGTRREVVELSATTRREIEEMREEGRDRRTDLSVGARREIAGLSREARLEIEQLRSRDRREGIAQRDGDSQRRNDRGNFELVPGEGKDADGNTVRGVYHHNRVTGERTFEPGISVTGRGLPGSERRGQTERMIAELRQENPGLTYAEALAMTRRAGSNMEALRREALALQAARADERSYRRDPTATLERYRKQYGLGPSGAPAAPGSPPPRPAPSPAPAPSGPSELPPAARSQLREGVTTQFNNGQEWTLSNGVPQRVR